MTSGDTRTVLVIEDEFDLRLAVTVLLDGLGYRVLEAATGEEGLALLERDEPDAVVLDFGLPDVDGLEVLRRIRTRAQQTHTKVVMLSAHASGHTAARAKELGCDAYIYKPFDPEELAGALDRLLAPA